MASTCFENFGNLAMIFFLRFARNQFSKHGGHVNGNQSPQFGADVLSAFLPSRPGTPNPPPGSSWTARSNSIIRCVRWLD